jgi:uncharacterized protein
MIDHVPPAGGGGYAAAEVRMAMLYLSGAFSTPGGEAQNRAEAAKWYRKASDGGNIQAMNDLAWLLATSTNAAMRNGAEAVALAEKAVAATSRTNKDILDTLAAAYAETGQFEKAVSTQKDAISLIKDEDSKALYISHLKLYETNSPYRAGN